MPTYEYVCLACGHEFELFQQMSDSVRKKCPECTKLRLKRLIGTGSGVIFKGGGFYETDYRSDSYKKDAKAEKKAKEGDYEVRVYDLMEKRQSASLWTNRFSGSVSVAWLNPDEIGVFQQGKKPLIARIAGIPGR